jgi:hypothetical protein
MFAGLSAIQFGLMRDLHADILGGPDTLLIGYLQNTSWRLPEKTLQGGIFAWYN